MIAGNWLKPTDGGWLVNAEHGQVRVHAEDMPNGVDWKKFEDSNTLPLEFGVVRCQCGRDRVVLTARDAAVQRCRACAARLFKAKVSLRAKDATTARRAMATLRELGIKIVKAQSNKESVRETVKAVLKQKRLLTFAQSVRAVRMLVANEKRRKDSERG